MKKIKISSDKLDKVLAQVMIEPSVVIHKKGGHIFAIGSDFNLEIRQELTFKRRKVIRLIRKFNKECELVKHQAGFTYVRYKTSAYKYVA